MCKLFEPQCICTPPSLLALWDKSGLVSGGPRILAPTDAPVCLVLPAATKACLPECKPGPFLNPLRSFTTTGLGEETNSAVVC